MRPRKKRSRKKRFILSAICILLAAYFTYTPIMSSLIADNLQSAIDRRLHAELQFDSLTYRFPYAVRITNARLRAGSSLGGENLLTIEQLDLVLARLPLPRRPVVIKSLEMKSPSLHVVRTGGGVVGAAGLKKTDEERRQRPPQYKLSEMFELRRFTITDGKIAYDDRTSAGAGPLVFRGITSDLGVTPESKAVYAYQLKSTQPPFVNIDANGTLDIDALVMDLAKLSMTVQSKQVEGESALPPTVQKVVNDLGIAGILSIDGSARLPLKDLASGTLSADMALTDARAVLPNGRGRLDDLDVKVHADLRAGIAEVRLNQLVARSGSAKLAIHEAVATADRAQWKLENLTGAIEAIAADSPTTQPASLAGTKFLRGQLPLTAQARGDYSSAAKYMLLIQPRDISLLLPGFSKPLENTTADIRVSDATIEIQNIAGDLLGGKAAMQGNVDLHRPPKYDVKLQLKQIDISQLITMPFMHDKVHNIAGSGNLSARITGSFAKPGQKMVDLLSADGDIQITQGRLRESKALTGIADRMGISRDTLTAGDVAAVFSIRDRVVTFRRGAVSTTLLGLQGTGTLSYDGELNLNIIAAPLGDWRDQLSKMNIPLVGGVASRLAGRVQTMISATSKLLYQFEVKGHVSDPQIGAVPAPALTEPAADLFGRMVQNVKSSELLKSLKE